MRSKPWRTLVNTSRAVGRLHLLLFATAFVAFAYFNQGGGWNQNSRFAMVRAIVEEGKFSIDDFLIYARSGSKWNLRRIPISNAHYQSNGDTNVLLWKTKSGQLIPINNVLEGELTALDLSARTIEVRDGRKFAVQFRLSDSFRVKESSGVDSTEQLTPGERIRVDCTLGRSGTAEATAITVLREDVARNPIIFRELGSVAASGDVAFYQGHFHPNKAPGTAFTGVPAYWLIFHFEKLAGLDPDDWWTLTVNAWLVSIFSVGLISAVGVSVFYMVATSFFVDRPDCNLLAAYTFAFGTMFFPNSTLLFEHNIVGAALLSSFYLLWLAKHTASRTSERAYCFLAGVFVGWGAITNYIAAVAVLILAGYAIVHPRRKTSVPWFSLGLLGPFLLICAYNSACFGTVFTTNYRYQNPDFIDNTGMLLHVFMPPQLDVLLNILFSPFRGLFFTAPVLLIAVLAVGFSIPQTSRRAEVMVATAMCALFLLFNISFNGWDGGNVAVPRYLGPMVPMLSLAVIIGFRRFFKTTCIFALASVCMMTLITVVDPQPPTGTGTAMVLDKPQWKYNPVWEYELPVFLHEKPLPLLREQEDQVLRYYREQLANGGQTEAALGAELERVRNNLEQKIAAGQPAPLILTRTGNEYLVGDSDLTARVGPVSAHTYGYYGGWIDGDFGAPDSVQARWNSFNAGELLVPESRWSLAPLFVLLSAGIFCSVVICR
jgi:hypothetical protein